MMFTGFSKPGQIIKILDPVQCARWTKYRGHWMFRKWGTWYVHAGTVFFQPSVRPGIRWAWTHITVNLKAHYPCCVIKLLLYKGRQKSITSCSTCVHMQNIPYFPNALNNHTAYTRHFKSSLHYSNIFIFIVKCTFYHLARTLLVGRNPSYRFGLHTESAK